MAVKWCGVVPGTPAANAPEDFGLYTDRLATSTTSTTGLYFLDLDHALDLDRFFPTELSRIPREAFVPRKTNRRGVAGWGTRIQLLKADHDQEHDQDQEKPTASRKPYGS
jgi:hypothetical protein